MPTVHIGAQDGQIASTVLMSGDPLRAQFIADRYLQDCVTFNQVRGMTGITGTVGGRRVSVMGHGMGMPSMGIYSYELFKFFDVQNILRVGSCGSLQTGVELRDIVFAMGSCTDSNWQSQYGLAGHFAPIASFGLLEHAVSVARQQGVRFHVGNTVASDLFYSADPDSWKRWASVGVLAMEMETAALYMNAAHLGRNALAMFTVSDHLDTGLFLSAQQRETTLTTMIDIALGVVQRLP